MSAKWTAALKAKGHTPVLDEDGKIDWFVCDGGYHNGPGCSVCLKSWCEHCTQDPDTIDECEGAPEVTPDPRDALVADMAEALREAEAAMAAMLPTNARLDNTRIHDGLVLPMEVSMGELRRLSAALTKAEQERDEAVKRAEELQERGRQSALSVADDTIEKLDRIAALRARADAAVAEAKALREAVKSADALLDRILKHGEIAVLDVGSPFATYGGKKPPNKEMWAVPRHMHAEIEELRATLAQPAADGGAT